VIPTAAPTLAIETTVGASRQGYVAISSVARRILITLTLVAILTISAYIIIRNGDLPVPIGAGIGILVVLIINNRVRNRRTP
jgi:hypothetical protein